MTSIMIADPVRRSPSASSEDRRPLLVADQGFSLRAAIMIALSFFPYLAIPLSSYTNVAIASFVAVLFAREVLTRPRLLLPVLVVALIPVLTLSVQSLLGYGEGTETAVLLWILHVAPLAGAAGAVVASPRTVVHTIRIFLPAAAVYVGVQKYFLEIGIIPFISLYDVPGYWSVPENAETIIKYVQRPFGWFPEASFMAGTLALASMTLLVLTYLIHRRLSAIDTVIVTLAVIAMFLGESGAALLTVPILAAMVFLPFSSAIRRTSFVISGTAMFLWFASELLQLRNARPNHSWDDRASSIIAGGRFLFDSLETFLLGVGCGGAPVLFQATAIPLDGLTLHNRLYDIYSVSGRFIMENGAVAGSLIILTLLVPIIRAFAVTLSWWFGILAAVGWLSVVTLAITYDSAAWLWILPGVCLGILSAIDDERDGPLNGHSTNDTQTTEKGPHR